MADAARKNARSITAKLSSKRIPLPSGKENARPSASSINGKNVSFANAGDCAAQESVRRTRDLEGFAGRASYALADSFAAKRPPFQVHRDDRNVPKGRASKERSRCNPGSGKLEATSSLTVKADARETVDRQIAGDPRRGEIDGFRDRKRLASGRWTTQQQQDKKLLFSKIPRRLRSSSVPSVSQNVSRSLALSEAFINQRSSCNIGSSNEQAFKKRRESKLAEETARTLEKGIVEGTNGHSSIAKNETKTEQKVIKEKIKSSITLVEETAPPLSSTLYKEVIRRNKCSIVEPLEGDQPEVPNHPVKRDSFPAELLCHLEYHDDLPIVEREKEERSPQLSGNFLKVYINADQRKLVVMFMIRLGTHCRYPSFIVYQAVKLFDAAMDRIPVETAFIQLTALASLWIALKKHQHYHKIPTATAMVAHAKELYAGREDLLIIYERKILQSLNFNLTFADAFALFSYHLINCGRHLDVSNNATTFLYHCGGYLIDVTLLDEQFCRTSAFLIALTAAELAFGLAMDAVLPIVRPRWLFWRGLLFAGAPHLYGRFQDKEIDLSRVMMLRRVLNSGRKHYGFEVVYKKYSRSRYGRISETLLELANKVSPLETFLDP